MVHLLVKFVDVVADGYGVPFIFQNHHDANGYTSSVSAPCDLLPSLTGSNF